MQTREDRIKRHYKALRRSYHRRHGGIHDHSVGQWIWMPLARKWEMSIREIKELVRGT